MYKLTAAVLAAVLVLILAVPAFASHDPNATGCAMAHECYEHVAKWFPPGTPENTLSVYAWNPNTGGYETIHAYGLAALCYNHGGYYYWSADGGEYWNAC